MTFTSLTAQIVEHPGPVVATSNRIDPRRFCDDIGTTNTSSNSRSAQPMRESHLPYGTAGPYSVNAHPQNESHVHVGVDGPTSPAAPTRCVETKSPLAPLVDPFLTLSAEVLDDFERVRVANENRLRQLTTDHADADGEERGFGLTIENPDVAKVVGHVRALLCDSDVVTGLGFVKTERRKRGCCREHDAERDLTAKMRAHPFGPWVNSTNGVGDKQAARLLAAIGDPAWHHQDDRLRTLRELWSYCGYGDAAAQVRRRGVKVSWDPAAKMRTHLIAVSCIRQAASPFRVVYEDARVHYADAVHETPCRRCGPSGQPAPIGSPLSAAHQHARGQRAVAKELLRALWIEARRIHGIVEGEQ